VVPRQQARPHTRRPAPQSVAALPAQSTLHPTSGQLTSQSPAQWTVHCDRLEQATELPGPTVAVQVETDVQRTRLPGPVLTRQSEIAEQS
jgi:hypothetical protein